MNGPLRALGHIKGEIGANHGEIEPLYHFKQVLLSKIEIVSADGPAGDAQSVHDVDHVLSVGDTRDSRRREEISAEENERIYTVPFEHLDDGAWNHY